MGDERLGALKSVSLRRQGFTATVREQMVRNSVNEAEAQAAHPRLGIGLPMSNIYATFVPWSYGRRSCLDQYHFQVLRGIVGPREHGWLRCVI